VAAQHVEAVKRATDAWNRDDYNAWIAYAHPDVEWTTVMEVFRGRDGARQAWDSFKAHQLRTRHDDLRDLGGDVVLALGEVTAVGPTTGLNTGSQLAQLVTFRDGLAFRIRDFSTHAEALAAAGLAE
jgi:ketosteroid isomerase-like protein